LAALEKMMKNIRQSAITMAVVAAMAVIMSGIGGSKLAARHDSPCDSSETHGPGTDTLCEGDGLHTDEYMLSPNGDLRFYFQTDGLTAVFDTTTDPWDQISNTYRSPYSDASHVMFDQAFGGAFFLWYSWCEEEGECFEGGSGDILSLTGSVCVRLTNSGLMELYDHGCSEFVEYF
jgi:hypothetical protein